MEFHKIAPDEWKRWVGLYQPVIEDWIKATEAKRLPARHLVADIRTLVDKYGKMSLSELMLDTIKNPAKGASPLAGNR